LNFEEGSGYLLRTLFGRLESFESEYYDLIRSAFLKYSMQARIGNMDGILVTYHNTAQIFGFQYVPMEEMDEALYGNKHVGQDIFEACVRMLEAINTEVIQYFPKQSVSCLWKTLENGQTLQVYVEPTEWEPGVEDEEKPIVQLDVSLKNLLDGSVVGDVVSNLGSGFQWSINYTIHTVKDSYSEIRARRHVWLEMKERQLSLPSDMSLEQMEQFWESGLGTGQAQPEAFNPNKFTSTSKFVEHLRRTSRMGAEDTMRLRKEERGKKKIVWKQPDDELDLEDWEQDVIDEGLEFAEAGSYDGKPSMLPSELRFTLEDSDLSHLRYQKSNYRPWHALQLPSPIFYELDRRRDKPSAWTLGDIPYAAATLLFSRVQERLPYLKQSDSSKTTRTQKSASLTRDARKKNTATPQKPAKSVKVVMLDRKLRRAKKRAQQQAAKTAAPLPNGHSEQAETRKPTTIEDPETLTYEMKPTELEGEQEDLPITLPPAIDLAFIMGPTIEAMKKRNRKREQSAEPLLPLVEPPKQSDSPQPPP